MLEILAMAKANPLPPGPTTLVGSYSRAQGQLAGYYGEVPESAFISANDLRSMLSPAGTAVNANTSWLKFTLDGKTLFVSRLSLTYSGNWDSLNAQGLIFGQKVVTIKGKKYKCRSFKTLPPGQSQAASIPAGNEWDRLLSNICTETNLPRQEGGKWGSNLFTPSQLGFNQGNGDYVICQEVNTDLSNRVWMRGYNSVNSAAGVFQNQSNTYNNMGWRPVLELVE